MEKPFHTIQKKCRLCFHKKLVPIFKLKPTPPAEWYFDGQNKYKTKDKFPLDIYMCNNCNHVQLVNVLDPDKLFTPYFYKSKTSPGLEAHFKSYASDVVSMFNDIFF